MPALPYNPPITVLPARRATDYVPQVVHRSTKIVTITTTVNIALQPSPTASTRSLSYGSTTPVNDQHHGLSNAQEGGIITICLLLLIAIGVFLHFCCWKRRSKQHFQSWSTDISSSNSPLPIRLPQAPLRVRRSRVVTGNTTREPASRDPAIREQTARESAAGADAPRHDTASQQREREAGEYAALVVEGGPRGPLARQGTRRSIRKNSQPGIVHAAAPVSLSGLNLATGQRADREQNVPPHASEYTDHTGRVWIEEARRARPVRPEREHEDFSEDHAHHRRSARRRTNAPTYPSRLILHDRRPPTVTQPNYGGSIRRGIGRLIDAWQEGRRQRHEQEELWPPEDNRNDDPIRTRFSDRHQVPPGSQRGDPNSIEVTPNQTHDNQRWTTPRAGDRRHHRRSFKNSEKDCRVRGVESEARVRRHHKIKVRRRMA